MHVRPPPFCSVGIFEGVASIEAAAYARLAAMGATPLREVHSAGGGAANDKWTAIRARALGVPVLKAKNGERSYMYVCTCVYMYVGADEPAGAELWRGGAVLVGAMGGICHCHARLPCTCCSMLGLGSCRGTHDAWPSYLWVAHGALLCR